MKHLLLALLLPSCVAYRGSDGTTFAMLGTNAESARAGDMVLTGVNQSEGATQISKAVIQAILIKGAVGVAKDAVKTGGETIQEFAQ
jgi:hypothetical protein